MRNTHNPLGMHHTTHKPVTPDIRPTRKEFHELRKPYEFIGLSVIVLKTLMISYGLSVMIETPNYEFIWLSELMKFATYSRTQQDL